MHVVYVLRNIYIYIYIYIYRYMDIYIFIYIYYLRYPKVKISKYFSVYPSNFHMPAHMIDIHVVHHILYYN